MFLILIFPGTYILTFLCYKSHISPVLTLIGFPCFNVSNVLCFQFDVPNILYFQIDMFPEPYVLKFRIKLTYIESAILLGSNTNCSAEEQKTFET